MSVFIVFLLLAEPSDSLGTQEEYSVPLPASPDKWISRDKFHHFSYSFGITGLSYHIYHCQLNNPNPGARYFSISLTSFVGISKELYDKFYKKSNFSYKDLVADASGIILATLLFTR